MKAHGFLGFCSVFLAVLVCAVPASANTYDWIGDCEGGSQAWDCEENWDPSAFCSTCYPNTASDDAIVEVADEIDLINETIDDVTVNVNGTVTFDGTGSARVMEVDTVTFSGASGALTVKLVSGASFEDAPSGG